MSYGDCLPEHGCITCGDEAVPLRVVEVGDTGLALCEDESGERTDIEVALIDPVAPGDEILAHAGTAIARAPEDREAGRREPVSERGAGRPAEVLTR